MLRYVEVLSIYDNLLQTNWFVSLRVCVCVWGGGGGGGGGVSGTPIMEILPAVQSLGPDKWTKGVHTYVHTGHKQVP